MSEGTSTTWLSATLWVALQPELHVGLAPVVEHALDAPQLAFDVGAVAARRRVRFLPLIVVRIGVTSAPWVDSQASGSESMHRRPTPRRLSLAARRSMRRHARRPGLRSSAAAQPDSVAPVVTTSSTRIGQRPATLARAVGRRDEDATDVGEALALAERVLRRRRAPPVQAAHGQPEPGGHGARQLLGLVEATLPTARRVDRAPT